LELLRRIGISLVTALVVFLCVAAFFAGIYLLTLWTSTLGIYGTPVAISIILFFSIAIATFLALD